MQNDTCLVVPGESSDPLLFAVHDERIYLFATSACIVSFRVTPDIFLPDR